MDYRIDVPLFETKDTVTYTDVIDKVHFRVSYTEEGSYFRPCFSDVVSLPDPSSDFVALEEVTKERVQEWVKNSIDLDGILIGLKQKFDEYVEAQTNTENTKSVKGFA